mgnify:CR=1 FL=1
MKKDTSYVLNRAERFHMVLIGESSSWSSGGGNCAAIPACAGICRRVAADDFALCKRFSGQDVFVVRYFGTVCGYCRLACEVGADDLRKWNSTA